jgi:hypothetical protein
MLRSPVDNAADQNRERAESSTPVEPKYPEYSG